MKKTDKHPDNKKLRELTSIPYLYPTNAIVSIPITGDRMLKNSEIDFE